MMKVFHTFFLSLILSALCLSPVISNGETVDEESVKTVSIADRIDKVIGDVNTAVIGVLFYDVSFGAFKKAEPDPVSGEAIAKGPEMPFLVVFLALGALYFTFYHRWINVRGFFHAISIVRGKYSDKADAGDLTPFRALTSALSATVGLGNIASVAVAMVAGGPGALFWMFVLGLFGMTAKFHESTLAQMYRIKNADGTISGGPMYYLSRGLKDVSPALRLPGLFLASIFAVFCVFASLGGGNMFQANQAYEGFYDTFVKPEKTEIIESIEQKIVLQDTQKELLLAGNMRADDVQAALTSGQFEVWQQEQHKILNHKERVSYGFGSLLAAIVAVVLLGGITRIGATTSRIVPFMALLYMGSCLTILFMHREAIPSLIGLVFEKAFSMESAYGGLIGVMMLGFQRAAFSSEAGLGSSAIAHSTAKTSEPVREGLVASLEPFIDTIVVCSLTGLVVLVTGAYTQAEGGSAVTLYAFEQSGIGAFKYILAISIMLFAFSTMLSWGYYGERAWAFLFGNDKRWLGLRSVVCFRLVFIFCVFLGAISQLDTIILFADLMLLSMALPNIIGGVILAPKVKRKLNEYWRALKSGEFKKESSSFDI